MPDHISKALETWYQPEDNVPWDDMVNQAMLQLNSESGELASLWTKYLYKPGHELNINDVIGELGDVWYYVRILCDLFNITIDELTDTNYEKLQGGHGWNGAAEKIKERLEEVNMD